MPGPGSGVPTGGEKCSLCHWGPAVTGRRLWQNRTQHLPMSFLLPILEP